MDVCIAIGRQTWTNKWEEKIMECMIGGIYTECECDIIDIIMGDRKSRCYKS